MSETTIIHNTFVIERTYPVSSSRVFDAWANPEAKAKWFSGSETWREIERRVDFRVGGREVLRGEFTSGMTTTFESTYHDIVPDARIIYVYDMSTGDRRISVSLATIEIQAVSGGTRMVVTEQGVFFEGREAATSRERGTVALIDKLGISLGVARR